MQTAQALKIGCEVAAHSIVVGKSHGLHTHCGEVDFSFRPILLPYVFKSDGFEWWSTLHTHKLDKEHMLPTSVSPFWWQILTYCRLCPPTSCIMSMYQPSDMWAFCYFQRDSTFLEGCGAWQLSKPCSQSGPLELFVDFFWNGMHHFYLMQHYLWYLCSVIHAFKTHLHTQYFTSPFSLLGNRCLDFLKISWPVQLLKLKALSW